MKNNLQAAMNFQDFNQPPTIVIAIIVQPSQVKYTNQTDKNISISAILAILVITGITLGRFFRYRKRKKECQQQALEVIREIEALNKIPKETTDREKQLSLQRKKQIETLEKIWNKTP
jgi:vacuolar-type H+-ATPase subunit I/STV1